MTDWNERANELAYAEGNITPDSRAAKALLTIYPAYDNDTLHSGLVDALSDLMHLCDLMGYSFAHIQRTAQGHYAREVSELGTAGDDELRNACNEALT